MSPVIPHHPAHSPAGFEFLRQGPWELYLALDAPAGLRALLPVLMTADGCQPSDSEPVRSSMHTTVTLARLALPASQPAVYLKRYHDRSLADVVKRLARGSRCERDVAGNQLLLRHGFSAPRTLLYGWRRGRQLRQDFFSLTLALAGCVPFTTLLAQVTDSLRRGRLLDTLGNTLGRLHRARIYHGDCGFSNLLADPALADGADTPIAFVDNERTRYRRLPRPHLAWRNLVELHLYHRGLLSSDDSARLLAAYHAVHPRGMSLADLRTRVAVLTARRRRPTP